MQRETRVAPSTGTRGGGWGAINFLHLNAGKLTTIKAKPGDRAREASCPPSGIKRMVEFDGSNKIPRRANYVCSENSKKTPSQNREETTEDLSLAHTCDITT